MAEIGEVNGMPFMWARDFPEVLTLHEDSD